MQNNIEILRMPKLGMSMTAGKVDDWYYAVGDTVNTGDDIVQVSTEKITHDVACETSGMLRRLLISVDETVDVETPLAVIAPADVSDALIDAALG